MSPLVSGAHLAREAAIGGCARAPRPLTRNRHIDHIPAGERHGKPWHQFAFWFGGNVNAFNVVLGAVIVSLGLNFWQALIAVAAGTLIGALLIALHATQGPCLARQVAAAA